MSAYQAALSDISFSVMEANLKLYERLHLPVISTARPFAFYRKIFFHNKPESALLDSFGRKRIVDIGCGLTPFTEDSMFQVCRRHGIDFYGVDPKLAQGFKFGLFDRIKSVATGATSFPKADMPGLEKAVPAYADDLPFAEQSVDIILSSWLLFAWIQDEALLVKIFTEFDRILKPGGQISFYPSMHLSRVKTRYPLLSQFLADYQKQQQFILGLNPGSLPPSYVTHLRKPV